MSSKPFSFSSAVFVMGAIAFGVSMVFAGLRPVEEQFSYSSYSSERSLASAVEQGPLSYLEEVTAHVLADEEAVFRELQVKNGRYARDNMFLVVTDENGVVRAHSRSPYWIGRDFSALYQKILKEIFYSNDGLSFICVDHVTKPLVYKKIRSHIYIVHAFQPSPESRLANCDK